MRSRTSSYCVAAAAVALVMAACGEEPAPPATGPLLRAVSPAGLEFRHRPGGVGKRELPEAMGGGVKLSATNS